MPDEIKPDYGLRAAELNMAGLVFSTYKLRGWTVEELWEKLPEPTKNDIRQFVAKYPPPMSVKLT